MEADQRLPHEHAATPRRRRRTSQELTAVALPLDPPAWTLTLEEFRARLGELTLVKLAISPCHLWGSTEPNGSYQSYLIAGDIACAEMSSPLYVSLDATERCHFATFAYKAGLPDQASQDAWRRIHEHRQMAERHAMGEAKRLLPIYVPYLGRPVKATLEEPTRGAPRLASSFAEGTSAHWGAEHAWERLLVDAIKAGHPMPEATKTHILTTCHYAFEQPKTARARRGTRPPAEGVVAIPFPQSTEAPEPIGELPAAPPAATEPAAEASASAAEVIPDAEMLFGPERPLPADTSSDDELDAQLQHHFTVHQARGVPPTIEQLAYALAIASGRQTSEERIIASLRRQQLTIARRIFVQPARGGDFACARAELEHDAGAFFWSREAALAAAQLDKAQGRDAIEVVEREHPYGNGTGYVVRSSLTPHERQTVHNVLYHKGGRERDIGLRTSSGEIIPARVLRLAAGGYARGVHPQSVMATLNQEGYVVARETLEQAFGALSPALPRRHEGQLRLPEPAPAPVLDPLPVHLLAGAKTVKRRGKEALQLGLPLEG